MRFRQKPLTNIFLSLLFNVQKMKIWNRQARKENNMGQFILGVGLGVFLFSDFNAWLPVVTSGGGDFFHFLNIIQSCWKLGPRVVFLNFCSNFWNASKPPLFLQDYGCFLRGNPDMRETCFNQAFKLSPPPHTQPEPETLHPPRPWAKLACNQLGAITCTQDTGHICSIKTNKYD